MIIHQPEIIRDNGRAILASRLECNNPLSGWPEYLWFQFPEEYHLYISEHTDAFVPIGLLAAMMAGEDVVFKGAVSPKLAYNLEDFQAVMATASGKKYGLKRVDVAFERLEKLSVEPLGVGVGFSGGVDSFFTLWNNVPSRQQDIGRVVSHALMMQGFDIALTENERYRNLVEKYQPALQRVGVGLISGQMNVRRIAYGRLPGWFVLGLDILGAPMALGKLFNKYYLSSSWTYASVFRRGIEYYPSLVYSWLRTDTLDIVHYGASHSRYEKLEAISDWQVVQNNLRVCFNIPDNPASLNCGICSKCIRTQAPLMAMDKLGLFQVFETPLQTKWDLFRFVRYDTPKNFYRRNLFHVLRIRRPDLSGVMSLVGVFLILMYPLRLLSAPWFRDWLGSRKNKFEATLMSFDNREVLDRIQDSQ